MKIKEYLEKRNFKLAKAEDHVVTQYLPYSRKMAEAKNIVEFTSYAGEGEDRRFCVNSPIRLHLFMQRLVENYTDLEFEDFNEDYDALVSSGAMDEIISLIPKREYEEFDLLVHMTLDDLMTNEREFAGYVDGKMELLAFLLENTLKKVEAD